MMGKFSNVEIVLEKANERPRMNPNTLCRYPTPELRNDMSRTPYFSDPALIPRIQKYLESSANKTYVNVNIMADDLQAMYKDYARRKRIPFLHSVKKAYSIILKNIGCKDTQMQVTSSEELSDDSEHIDEAPFEDSLNNQVVGMYKSSNKLLNDDELIDISSDDSEDQPALPESYEKPTNGASTSQNNENYVTDSGLTVTKKSIKYFEENDAQSSSNEHGKKRKIEPQEILPYQSSTKKKKSAATLHEPSVTFKDVGGVNNILENVCKLLIHIKHPEVYRQIGISPPRGFLLHGPPGCGKTLVANAIAGELGIPMLKVAGPELVAGISGESEERIRTLFERAVSSTPCILFIDEVDAITPNRQHATKEMERRIVAQLLSCLDDLNQNAGADQLLIIGATNRPDAIDPALRRAGRFDREVCLGIPDNQARKDILKVITSKLKLTEDFDFDTIAKCSPGFVGADLKALAREAAMVAVNRVFNILKEKREHEKAMALQKASQQILNKPKESEIDKKVIESTDTDKIIVDSNEPTSTEGNDQLSNSDVVVIDDDSKTDKSQPEAKATPKLNIEDTEKLHQALHLLQPPPTVLESLKSWLHDEAPLTREQLSNLHITMDDFKAALKFVQPSAKREGFATVPDVTWDDIGSLRDIRQELQMAILAPVRHAEEFKKLGLTTPTGVLLCGPPGCGKTLLAKAIANEAGINFISVKGPELLNMYVGESEKAVRLCFQRARNSAPCVIFFDELDALCPKRSETGEGGVTMRVVNQMLTEMDGIDERLGVYLLAASNRPDIIDPAVLRPGRLDKIIYVGLPTPDDRVDILKAITKNGTRPLLSSDVDLEFIGKSTQCDGYTGADLAALVREAGMDALKDYMAQINQQQSLAISTEHFKRAITKIRPSVPEKDQKHYDKLKKIYSVSSIADGDVEEMEYS